MAVFIFLITAIIYSINQTETKIKRLLDLRVSIINSDLKILDKKIEMNQETPLSKNIEMIHSSIKSFKTFISVLLTLSALFVLFLACTIAKLISKEGDANRLIINQKNALDSAAIVAETDIKGKITYINDKFLEISKFSRNELMGEDHRILNSELHPETFFTNLWSVISSGKIWHGEIKNKAKDGTFYWVDTTIFPVIENKNKISKYVAIRFDITFQKNQEIKLVEEKNKAENAERAKSAFLANMSHEIRTPMNGVLGMIQLLAETPLSAEQKEMLETSRSSGDNLMSILNDILDLSKIDSGKVDLEIINFDLKKCVEDALQLSSIKSSKKDINMRFEDNSGAKHLWFKGDVSRIGQILTNYLSNAIKFTSKGEIVISISLNNIKEDKSELTIDVKDTGIGIPKNAQGKLFQAFSQADNSTTRRFGGTGLGLSICLKLSEMMGGTAYLVSKDGEGSTFTSKLVLQNGIPQDQENLAETKEGIQASPLRKTSSHKILVVEDNAINQKLAKAMLKKFDHNCDIAVNGLEALKAIEKEEYALIFMDMQMPIMDGITATNKIIEQLGDSAPPIVAMTANAYPEDKERCKNAGMVYFLAKPMRLGELKKVLNKFIPES